MAYITHPELAESPGALELAQVASDEHVPPVSAELLDALLRAQDVSAWGPEDVAAATRVIGRIDAAVREAGALIDGYLAKRGYQLPLAPVPGLVTAWCRASTRYLLHKNRRTLPDGDPVLRGWRDALRLLDLTAAGKFSLGAEDAVANDRLDARFCAEPRTFARSQLKGFR